ncbi:MAG: universal stress protein [Burkholderiales bacterium]|nr:MAG: universal stress protein [Burkholderiales bacterium]
MFKHIFVPIDGSATSQVALETALQLAKEQGAEVRIVHVFKHFVVSSGGGPIDLTEAFKREGETALARAENRAREAGVPAATELIDAGGRRIPGAIVEEAARWPADLIVMGTHGRHGFEHLLLGSVAEGVARRSPIPVMLVRGR